MGSFAKSPHLPKCAAGLPTNTPIAKVDVAWTFDGGATSPITMGFDSPSRWFHGMKKMIKSFAKPMKMKTFLKLFLGMAPLQCDQEEAHYSDGVEIQRHVLEAIDVIFPQYAGAHEHWNQTCA